MSLLTPNSAASSNGLARQPYLPKGRHEGVDCRGRKFQFTNDRETTMRLSVEFDQAMADERRDPLLGQCDYDHHSLDPASADTRASGRIEGFDWDDGFGTVALIRWTPSAQRAIADGEYTGFSPVFDHDDEGRLTEFFGGALTNDPAFREVKVAARSGDRRAHLAVLAAGRQGPDQADDEPPAPENAMDLLQELRKRFGLSEDAQAEAVLSAVDDLIAKIGEAAEDVPVEGETVMARAERIAGGLVQARAAKSAADAELVQLRAARDTLTSQVTALTAERDTALAQCRAARESLADREAESELDKFADRIPPAERAQCKAMFLRSREEFAAAMAARPANMIPLRGQGAGEAGASSGADESASGMRQRIQARSGELRRERPELSREQAEMAAYREIAGAMANANQ